MKGNTKHGKYGSSTYHSWDNMIRKCKNSKNNGFSFYGGRGIGVDPSWKDFVNFFKDMGERPVGLFLGRIDTNKNFNLENCKWMTKKEQCGYRRKQKPIDSKFKGKNHHLYKENSWRWIEDRNNLKKSDNRKGDTLSIECRIKTLIRDGGKCKINNGDCCGRLEVHHILNWTEYPELRYDPNNLITLCHEHHPRGRKKEEAMSPYLQELIKQ